MKTQTATVYLGGRRRWFSLDAACNAEATTILSRFCDCSPGNGRDVAPETCAMHRDDERYNRVRAKLAARARRQRQVEPVAMAAPEQRAIAACRALFSAKAEVDRLSRRIGESLNACPMMQDIEYGPNGPITHLSLAYAAEDVENDHGWGGTHKEWNNQHLLDDCPHCLAAHNAIQERKLAKKRLGVARRAVTMIGRMP
ncbi:MAG: hypothetical protein V4724_26765 [Pseudomonadota bacterium]